VKKINTVKCYQSFYLPVNIIKKTFDFSKALKGFNNELKILEPMAGICNIVVDLIKLQKDYKIYMVEIEESRRKVLQVLVDAASDKGLSFITNRQRRNEGTFCASELAGIEPTPPAPKEAGYVRLDHSAIY
jgi:hypothetical protein